MEFRAIYLTLPCLSFFIFNSGNVCSVYLIIHEETVRWCVCKRFGNNQVTHWQVMHIIYILLMNHNNITVENRKQAPCSQFFDFTFFYTGYPPTLSFLLWENDREHWICRGWRKALPGLAGEVWISFRNSTPGSSLLMGDIDTAPREWGYFTNIS